MNKLTVAWIFFVSTFGGCALRPAQEQQALGLAASRALLAELKSTNSLERALEIRRDLALSFDGSPASFVLLLHQSEIPDSLAALILPTTPIEYVDEPCKRQRLLESRVKKFSAIDVNHQALYPKTGRALVKSLQVFEMKCRDSGND
jgi:hypothetical protein